MKRIIIATALALGLTLAAVAPASATVPNGHAEMTTVASGNPGWPCVAVATIENNASQVLNQVSFRTNVAPGSGGAADGTCVYIGFKYRIQRCDGTYSTSAEIGQFNPYHLQDGPILHPSFSCAEAGVVAMYLRLAGSYSWTPPQSGSGSYITYLYADVCDLTQYCIGDDGNF